MKQTAVEWFLNEFKKQVWFEENLNLRLKKLGLHQKKIMVT